MKVYFESLGMPSKKNAKKVTLEHTGQKGGKQKSPFCFIKKGTYLYGGRGQNIFVTCPMFPFVILFLLNL